VQSFPHDYAQQYASNALVLLAKIGIAIDRDFAVLPLTVNFPAIAPGTPIYRRVKKGRSVVEAPVTGRAGSPGGAYRR
jgi:hypothetical protein